MQPVVLHLVCFFVLNLLVVFAGYLIIKNRSVMSSWLLLIAAVIFIQCLFMYDQSVLRMLALIATTFTGMKVIAATQSYFDKPHILSLKQWMAFAIGWAGMRAEPFEKLGQPGLDGAWRMIWYGVSRIVSGLILILLAHGLNKLPINNNVAHLLITAFLLVGFSLILHFGLLSISAGNWRLKGVNVYLLFRQPAMALSLTELWSKRWNIAFSEMTSIAVYRPLKNQFGSAVALLAGFTFSGILHELALSLPVNSGYGLPTLYFIIQGVIVLLEKKMAENKRSIIQNKVVAHLWVFFWLVIPMPLLFHPAFVRQIVWPLGGF